MVGKWYRQLMGESIGKEWNKHHDAQVWMGITPTVSIGSTDLHSMAQLYFGGPNDKFFTLVTVKESRHDVAIPRMQHYDALVHHIQGAQLSAVMHAICEGTQRALIKQNRPFCHLVLPDTKEESIGALLQLHMMEIMYLAALFDLNAFDQPNVESYKIETKRILAKGGKR
jgi:glucose-6-phosphate isomerase